MILEHAILSVKPGEDKNFEQAIGSARALIAASDGFKGLDVRPCIEQPGQYLLLVWWDALEDHTDGFRNSDLYQDWKAARHHFYDPFPLAQHFGPSVVD
ncbi:MAG: antibiotic biosynthesis monooxygenase [Proteobacteria bacterium]|jgi:heme-degrading monooxygenase HmoA|nr:antibiotic biosynthesis monooxygenase [Pseudomonadota bacterium]